MNRREGCWGRIRLSASAPTIPGKPWRPRMPARIIWAAGRCSAPPPRDGVQTLTPAGLREICRSVRIPVVAIGGITAENLPQLRGTGASGAAVVSAIFAQPDKKAAAQALSALAREAFEGQGHSMKTALTIAGSDSSGGAGIQADIKTMMAHGVYAMSAITALTAQNTTGVFGIQEASPEFLQQELDCVFTDIFPTP